MPKDAISGIIYKAMSGFYYVKYANSANDVYMCTAPGKFRHKSNHPLVGDRVLIETTGEQGKGVLTEILPRKNSFVRPPLANVDVMIIVASKAIPVTDPYLIDKMTVIALSSECNPVICINKQDIDEADDLFEIYEKTGFMVVRTSAVNGIGIDELKATVVESVQKGNDNIICALCGNSGVGKSSILNAINPNFSISTGDVSHKLGRGRHTTRHVELYESTDGILIADTPGFSSFDTGGVTEKEKLQFFFPEFKLYSDKCRFDDCAHLSEPGCAVIEAVENGDIHKVRYENYVRLYKQLGIRS